MTDNGNMEVVHIPKEGYEELKKRAEDCDYYRGRVDGMEYVIDSLENAFKGADNE